MNDSYAAPRDPVLAWSATDLRRALLRRANFVHAGHRRRRSGAGLAHAGVPRRAIRRLGQRAAAALARNGRPTLATDLVARLMQGAYHDEQMLALEVIDRLSLVWPEWTAASISVLSRSLRHPWVADRLARIQGRLIARDPSLLSKHGQWAVSPNPLRRRAAAIALLACGGGKRSVPAAKALPIMRLLLEDPEPHPWVQQALGRAVVHYARRAPRTMERLLAEYPDGLSQRHRERARRLLDRVASAS